MANKSSIKQEINSLRASFERDQLEAKKAFEDKLSEMLVTVKSNVGHYLEEAQTFFEGLDKTEQESVLDDAKIKEHFAFFAGHRPVLQLLQEVQAKFETLDAVGKDTVKNNADIKAILQSFGYKRNAGGGGGGGKGGRYDEKAILAFLADGEKEQAAIQAQFNTSKQSVVVWGKKLFDAGKIYTIEKRGRQKFWMAKA